MEIKRADQSNFTINSLDSFERYQVVNNVYRMVDGHPQLVRCPFTEDWSLERRREKAEEVLSGNYIVYCAFEGDRVVGNIMLLPKLDHQRMIIDSYHVSNDFRRQGIGRALFKAAKEEALSRGAVALYASACSSEETIHFYQAMGFVLTPHPIASLAEEEPYDLQLECPIIE